MAVGLVAAAPFFVATTFFGDDHLFLAFARHVGNPFLPFVRDLHGGEYYRPLWMLVWWLLARARRRPLAVRAALRWRCTPRRRSWSSPCCGRSGARSPSRRARALLMFLAPQNLAAALWFSATTDLLATVFVLGSLVALLRGRRLVAALAALAAFLSKESAFVLPLLSALLLALRERTALAAIPARRRRSLGREIAPQLILLAAVCVARRAVLHGWGGSGDPRAGLAGTILQIFAGFAQTFTGDAGLPAAARLRGRHDDPGADRLRDRAAGEGDAGARFAPLAFAVAAAAPLFAAGWAVGARYYYLPAVGLCWAVAEALDGGGVGPAARVTLAAVLLLVGGGRPPSGARRSSRTIGAWRRRGAQWSPVSVPGITSFTSTAASRISIWRSRRTPPSRPGGVLVLGDVPASFVVVPPAARGLRRRRWQQRRRCRRAAPTGSARCASSGSRGGATSRTWTRRCPGSPIYASSGCGRSAAGRSSRAT